MATINAISVALFNAAAGGYTSELTTNGAALANAVGPILEKDISTNALFVEHLLSNFGIASTNAVYAEAKAALAGLVTSKGRLGAATDAIDYLKTQEGTNSAFAAVANAFAVKVAAATAYSTANANERDITKLISAVTGVDTDVAATNAAVTSAVAAQKAADDAALAAAVKTVTDAAAAAKVTADAALAKANTDLAAAQAKLAAIDNTTFASEQAAADAAKAAAEAVAKSAADLAALKAASDLTAAKNAADLAALKAAGDLAAAKSAADLAALKAANDLKSAQDAAAAAKTAADLAAAKAAADIKTLQDAVAAAKTAADTAAAKAAADLQAAQAKLAAVDNTEFASEKAAADAATLAAQAVAKADAQLAAVQAANDLKNAKAAADLAAFQAKVASDTALAKAAADLKDAQDAAALAKTKADDAANKAASDLKAAQDKIAAIDNTPYASEQAAADAAKAAAEAIAKSNADTAALKAAQELQAAKDAAALAAYKAEQELTTAKNALQAAKDAKATVDNKLAAVDNTTYASEQAAYDAAVAAAATAAANLKVTTDAAAKAAQDEINALKQQVANLTVTSGLTLTANAPTVTEGDTGTKNLTFIVTLDKAPTSAVSVNYQTLATGTATAGDDFEAAAGVVTFAAGQTFASVTVTVNGDTTLEGDETVAVQFSGAALKASVTATGTIRDNEVAVVDPTTFTVSAGDIATANAQNVPVTLNVGNTGAKTVTIQSDGARANAGVIINGDSSTTITSGASSDIITVSGNGNNTITTGAGSDSVSIYGSGNNTVNVGAGSDSVTGGTGNDTVVFASGALGEGDFVTGGSGVTTVRISGDGNVIAVNDAGNGAVLTGVENIVLDGTTLTIDAQALVALIAAGFKSISGHAASSEIIITNLNTVTNALLDLSSLDLIGGLKSIKTNGTGTIVLTTEQAAAVETIAAATGTLTQQVIVEGAQTVAEGIALIASGVTAKFALADTAANLALAPVAVFNKAVSFEATTVATAAQATAIATTVSAATGFTATASNIKYSVSDTASMLANYSSGLGNAKTVTATTDATVAEANAIATAVASGAVTTSAVFAVKDSISALTSALSETVTVTTTTGSPNASVASTAGYFVGMTITGANIPAGTTVISINGNGTAFTLSANATSSGADSTGAVFKNATVLNAATGVTISGEATVFQVKTINSALTAATGGLTKVVNGYNLTDAAADLINSSNSAITSAAKNVTVASGAAVSVADAIAIESLTNSGSNTYKLDDTSAVLRTASSSITEVATKATTGGAVASGTSSDALTVAELNAVVAKFGATAFSTARKVVDTAAEIVKLTPAALSELGAGDIEVLSTSTATVAELLALNTFLTVNGSRITQDPGASTVKVADTAANLDAAVKVATTLAALDASHSVKVTGTATVAQISAINAKLATPSSGGLSAVASGYELVDTAAKLSVTGDSDVTRDIVDAADKVTVSDATTVATIDVIADAYLYGSPSYETLGSNLGTKITYSLKDTAAAILSTTLTVDGSTAVRADYVAGATTISITNKTVAASAAVSLRALTNFDGVYAIEDNVAGLNAANLTAGEPNVTGRAAMAGATSVTLVDSISSLFSGGVPVAEQALARTVIANNSLSDLTSANANDKAAVDGFRLTDASVTLTDLTAVNALSAIAPTEYVIATNDYADLMGTGTGVETFVSKAKSLTVTDVLTVSKFNALDARAAGTITFTLEDSASALASTAAALATAGATTVTVSSSGTKPNATVAEAKILIARGISGFVINDTAANISAAGDTVLLDSKASYIKISDGGEVTLSVAAALKTFDRASSSANAGNPDGASGATYNLVDTAQNLAGADAELIGFAKSVTATNVATDAYGATLAGRTAMGSITYDVSASTYSANMDTAANGARNVTVTDAVTVTNAVLLQAENNTGTTSYKISGAANTIALVNNASNATAIAAIEAATGTVVVNNGSDAIVSAAEATLIAAYNKPVTYDLASNATLIGASTVSAGALNEARDISVAYVSTNATTIADTTVSAALATKLLAATNSGTTTLGLVSAKAADAKLLTLTSNDVITALSVTGTTSLQDAVAINSKDTGDNIGSVAFSKITGSGADVLANLAVTALATTVEVTDRVTVAQAKLLQAEDASDGNTDYTYSITDTFANLMANSDATANDVDAVAAITAADKITVTGDLTIAQATSIVNVTATPDVALFELVDVYSLVDSDQNIVAALAANNASLTKAQKITMSNGVSIKLDTVGGNLQIVGTKAEIDALPKSLATARKLIETSVADLNANSAYFTSAPSNVSYRVVDEAANLLTNNPLVNTADSITVIGNVTMAQATAIRGLGVSASEIKYSLQDTTALLVSGSVLTDAINITATTPATVSEAGAFITAAGATGKATYSISEADTATSLVSGNAATFNGATNITVTATTNGYITATEAAVLLGATNSGSTTISKVSDSIGAVVALVKGANDTITSIAATGNTTVENAKVLQDLSSSVTYTLVDTGAKLAAAGDAVLNGATTIALASGEKATLAQLSVIDAATPSNANTTVAVADTAANILAASTSLLARANGAITLTDTAVTASTVTDLETLDAATTFSIDSVTGVKIVDTADNLLLTANASAVAAATKVTVSDAMTAAKATLVVAAVNTGGGDTGLTATDFVFNVTDTYSAVALASSVSALAAKVTITNTVSASQAKTADDWAGAATYAVRDSAAQLATSTFATALGKATSVTATTAANVTQAGKLSEMTNLVSYTIKDTAQAVHDALNTVNGAGTADRASVLKAASISLDTAATVAYAVGVPGSSGNGEKLGLGSIAGLSFKVSDSGVNLLTALDNTASSAILLNASTVELNGTTGVSIAGLTKLADIFGAAFINHVHDSDPTTANRYYIKDAFTNVLVADMAFVEGATTVEVDGTSSGDTINLSAFNKGMTITGGAGVDDITGGSGNDVFVFATSDIDTTAGAVTDIIQNFSSGDTIDGSFGAASGAGVLVEAGASVVDLATLLSAADTALNGTVKYYVGQVTGGDVYVVTDSNGTGYTEVIKLVGVTLATFDGTTTIV